MICIEKGIFYRDHIITVVSKYFTTSFVCVVKKKQDKKNNLFYLIFFYFRVTKTKKFSEISRRIMV